MNLNFRDAHKIHCFSQSDGEVCLQALPDVMVRVTKEETLILLTTVLMALKGEGDLEKLKLARKYVNAVLP